MDIVCRERHGSRDRYLTGLGETVSQRMVHLNGSQRMGRSFLEEALQEEGTEWDEHINMTCMPYLKIKTLLTKSHTLLDITPISLPPFVAKIKKEYSCSGFFLLYLFNGQRNQRSTIRRPHPSSCVCHSEVLFPFWSTFLSWLLWQLPLFLSSQLSVCSFLVFLLSSSYFTWHSMSIMLVLNPGPPLVRST